MENEFARKEGLDLYIETQFCFEAAPVVAWERRIRASGNDLPIRVGIPGPATIKTLLRFAQISGIGPSMRHDHQAGEKCDQITDGSVAAHADCRSCRGDGRRC